jgi:formate--tetrahydrofolate ligase
VTAADLNAHGAMAVLLRDAFKPNLVQTIENNPAFVHGGPFANIAHGCNTVIATRTALKLGDYVVTEAGFGADLGAEKFVDIKCRASGLKPAAAVVVATVRALKFHGGMDVADLKRPDAAAVRRGLVNLERHVRNVRERYGLACAVSINRFDSDTPAEIDAIVARMRELDVPVALSTHWADGGRGAADLARLMVDLCERGSSLRFVYPDEATLVQKIEAVARDVYGASNVNIGPKARRQLDELHKAGHGGFPVCIAKTQYSFSTDPTARGAPSGHTLDVREVRLSAGAQFVVAICGDIMTMPGLPKDPAASRIDLVDGKVIGLS